METNLGNFNTIYKKYYNSVFHFIVKKVANRELAEELASDVFLIVHQKLDCYDSNLSKLNTWLLNIANNKIIDYYRSKVNTNKGLTTLTDSYVNDKGDSTYEYKQDTSSTPDKILENKELKKKIDAAIEKLPAKYKTPIHMFLIEGHKYEKISDMLQLPINTVKIHIMRAKELLRVDLIGVS